VGGIITLFRPARRACRDSDIWLGLVLLFCLVGLASFKLAFGAPRPIAVIQASAASRENALRNWNESVCGHAEQNRKCEPGLHLLLLQRSKAGIGMTRSIGGLRKARPERSSQRLQRKTCGESRTSRQRWPATRIRVAHSGGSSAGPRPAEINRTEGRVRLVRVCRPVFVTVFLAALWANAACGKADSGENAQ
jgi:hypothetical protein